MIAIAVSNPRERAAFAALCGGRGWACVECASVGALGKYLRLNHPRVVLTRHKLNDGYSDDVLGALAAAGMLPLTKVIVLLGPGGPSSHEPRQIALGADTVLRDPVRADVIVEYLAKYLSVGGIGPRKAPASPQDHSFAFAGATIHPFERSLRHGDKFISLTPREVQLAERLVESVGEVATYEALYSEVLGRGFRGDTSNLRVLLGKLDASFRSVGLPLRRFVEVIPKTGYRYSTDGAPKPGGPETSPGSTSQAA
jgi:DNA-binding response OmpR family regulator